MTDLSQRTLSKLRDAVLVYVYEHGAAHSGWCVPAAQIRNELGISHEALSRVVDLMAEQELLPSEYPVDSIGLSAEGEKEAEALGAQPAIQHSAGGSRE